MKEERENITRNNTEQYPRFIWNYEKEEEEEKNDMDKRLAKTKRGKGSIQRYYWLPSYLFEFSDNSTFQTLVVACRV